MRLACRRLVLLSFLLLYCVQGWSYVGPGAGFAVLGSFAAIIGALILAACTIFFWPIVWLIRAPRRYRAMRRARFRRTIVLGLDGMSPELLEPMMHAGELPNLQHLRDTGCYRRLTTTTPPISPVAWSTFQTGVNPGKHGVFDFIGPAPGSYLPRLAFSEVTQQDNRGKAAVHARLLRRSQPFWKLLSAAGIPATILRIPVTFPCEKFDGCILGAMGIPDLRGTQGNCTVVTDAVTETTVRDDSLWVPVRETGHGCFEFDLPGPKAPDGTSISISVRMNPEKKSDTWRLCFGRTIVHVVPGTFSEWVPVDFHSGRTRVRGQVRFLLRSISPSFHLYISPINIDPHAPALPISWPPAFAFYLSKALGRFSTLGICEDMSAVNDGALTLEEFRRQVMLTYQERSDQWFYCLQRWGRGVMAMVFDLPDRLQHMFWSDGKPAEELKDLYRKLDALVGQTMRHLSPRDLLIILSDHGFCSFHRSVNLNAWLLEMGWLALKPGCTMPASIDDVDWTRTKAYAQGLCGIYLNLQGREPQGCVTPDERPELEWSIRAKLLQLEDNGRPVMKAVRLAHEVYHGPYVSQAPDLIAGFHKGYRMSSHAAITRIESPVIEDNTEPWRADHCVDVDEVPGIFLSNHKLRSDCRMQDVAATILESQGIARPDYMDGVSLLDGRKSQEG